MKTKIFSLNEVETQCVSSPRNCVIQSTCTIDWSQSEFVASFQCVKLQQELDLAWKQGRNEAPQLQRMWQCRKHQEQISIKFYYFTNIKSSSRSTIIVIKKKYKNTRYLQDQLEMPLCLQHFHPMFSVNNFCAFSHPSVTGIGCKFSIEIDSNFKQCSKNLNKLLITSSVLNVSF